MRPLDPIHRPAKPADRARFPHHHAAIGLSRGLSAKYFETYGTKAPGAHFVFYVGSRHAGMTSADGCDVVCHGQGGVRLAVILLVEDEIFLRENAEWVLEDLGHNALSASDVGEAFIHLGSSQHIDALFVDIRLKTVVRGGYDIANQAIKSRPDLRVLYTSGTSLTAEMKSLFVEDGHYLQKPYTESQLQNAIEGLLAASV